MTLTEKSHSTMTLEDFSSTTIITEKVIDDYNPFEHRDKINGVSTAGSLAHLLKCSLGGGILAMPLAFKNAGLLFGVIGSLIIGGLCTHCVYMLVRTSQNVCRDAKKPSLGFSTTAEIVFKYGPMKVRAWSNFAKQFVDVTLGTTYYATLCVYTVFVATSFHDVINYEFDLNWDIRIYIGLTVIPQLLVSQIRRIKDLVPFSVFANLFIVIAFSITLYYMFSKPLVFSNKPLMAEFSKLPAFFTTVLFAMEGIGTVMPVENAMKKPQHFLGSFGILNIAMFIVVLLYGVIGFFGYVRYGDTVLGSITLNLEPGSLVADIAKLLMGLSVFCSYGLLFHVPTEIIWRNISNRFSEKTQYNAETALRVFLVVLSGSIAAVVPNLEPFIGLVGAVCLSILGIFIPSFLETVYLWPNKLGWCKWKLIKNVMIGMLSVFFLITGSYVSVQDIVSMYKNQK